MMTFLDRHLTTPVTIRLRVTTDEDRYGNPIYSFGEPTRTLGRLVERVNPESPDGRSSDETFTLYLPASMAGQIDAFARVEIEGHPPMEVAAAPVEQFSLTSTAVHHVQVTVRSAP